MKFTTLLYVVASAAVVWGIVSGIRIYDFLRRRGDAGSFIWIRLMLPVYLSRYAKITRAENGRTGPLFFHYVIAFNLALVAVLIVVAIHGSR
jgi:hypothetical protein